MEILRILSEQSEPVGSSFLQREMARRGFLLSDRAIRYHLRLLEERGLVESHGKAERTITRAGLEELGRSLAYKRIGSILTWYLSLAYRTTYSLDSGKGRVVANVFMFDKKFESKALQIVENLYSSNLLPAPYAKILEEEEEYEDVTVPKGRIALLTVCNLTIDGVLMHSGIPLILRYGGSFSF